MPGIFDALDNTLTSPTFNALLGMSKGFGEASMPSRMPIPWGATLGMGMGGLQGGIQTGQALRKAGIENQRSQMLMDWYKQNYGGGQGAAGAPLGMPQQGNANGMYLRSPQQIAGMGDLAMATGQDRSAATLYGLPNTMAGGAGYAMGPGGTAFPVPGGAADPRTVMSKSAAEAGGKAAVESQYQAPQYFDMPVTDASGQSVLDANGQPTFRKQLMNPVQANRAAAGAGSQPGPSSVPAGSIPASDWATRLGGTENATGNPAAKNPRSSATGNGQFIDSTWIDQVRKQYPDQTARMTDQQILAQRSDPILSHQMTMAYGNENAGALSDAGIPPNSTTLAAAHKLGPGDAVKVLGAARTMPQTPLSSILSPAVIAANPQFARQTAGSYVFGLSGQFGAAPVDFGRGATRVAPGLVAGSGAPSAPTQSMPGIAGPPVLTPEQEAALKVRTAQQMPYDLRTGGMHIDPAAGTETKNPELKEITLQDGTKQFVHINPASPTAPAGTAGVAAPVGMAGAPNALVGSAVSPDTQEARDHLVAEFHGKDADSYVAAQNTQGWLNQIDHAADVMNKAGSLYGTGPFASQRLGLMGSINDAGRAVGIGSMFDQNAIASAEEMRKATTTAGFELSSHYEGHARQAAATIMNATSAVPGMSNSPMGVSLVSAGIHEGAQSAMDAHEYKQQRYNGVDPLGINPNANGKSAGAGLETAETDFYKKFPASMYSTRAISTVQPPTIAAKTAAEWQQKAEQYLPGTQVILNGQPKIVPPRPGAPAIPVYIQQRFMQPHG